MLGSDRSWDSDRRRAGLENRQEEVFIAGGRKDGEGGGVKEQVFEKPMAYKIHHRKAREAGHGKGVGPGGMHGGDDREKKKDGHGSGKESGEARGGEDVDAVWHRGSRPRNF